MAEIFSGLASMPRSETMKPSSMPLGTPKTHGVELDAFRSEFCKGLPKINNEVVIPLGLNHDVINVGLNGPLDKVPKALEHTALVRGPIVLLTERH